MAGKKKLKKEIEKLNSKLETERKANIENRRDIRVLLDGKHHIQIAIIRAKYNLLDGIDNIIWQGEITD